jgi:acyl-CoA dehydrogenase
MSRLSEESRMIVETVRRFVQNKVQPLENEVETLGHIPPEQLKALKGEAQALGLFALNMPAEVGGGGLSTFDMCLVEEQFGQTSDALIRRVFLDHHDGPPRKRAMGHQRHQALHQ